MDWTQIALTWGPAGLAIIVLLKSHWDLVYKIIPQGFNKMKRLQLSLARDARRRHRQHLKIQKAILHAIIENGCSEKKRSPTPKRRAP